MPQVASDLFLMLRESNRLRLGRIVDTDRTTFRDAAPVEHMSYKITVVSTLQYTTILIAATI